MSKIETYNDLLKEKSLLEATLLMRREKIKRDISEIKEGLLPVSHAVDNVKKVFSRDRHNPLVNIGLNMASDLVLKKFLLARAGWFMKLVVPYLIKNYSSHLISQNSNKKLLNFGVRINKDNTRDTQLSKIRIQNGHDNFLHKLGSKLKS